MKQDTKPINKRIATYRKLAGYTQQSAADALGLKKNTYARMELHGNPKPEILAKLAVLYNVSINLILYGVDGGQTADMQKAKEITRLEEKPHPFTMQKTDITLTVNEKNCIKACRKLSKKDRDQVMALINRLYSESKK